MNTPLKLTQLTTQLVGQPYALSDPGGLDCFSVIMNYLRLRGVNVPDEFKGRSTQDYRDLFLSDPDEAKRLMIEFVSEFMTEIRPTFAFAGDVLLAHTKGDDAPSQYFLGIHGGNGCLISATEQKGVVPIPIRAVDISRAFRIGRAA